MRKILLIALLLSTQTNAYNIHGEHAMLINCSWGKMGYDYGNIGTYKTLSGNYYTIFFGNKWCDS